jgi:hypothetical protein
MAEYIKWKIDHLIENKYVTFNLMDNILKTTKVKHQIVDTEDAIKLFDCIRKQFMNTKTIKLSEQLIADHQSFLKEYPKEATMYNEKCVDSWIYYICNNSLITKSDLVDKTPEQLGLTYRNAITWEVRQGFAVTHNDVSILPQKFRYSVLRYVKNKNWSWGADNEQIKFLFELHSTKTPTNNKNIKKCLCKTDFIQQKIKSAQIMTRYNPKKDLKKLHKCFCPIHEAYISQYKDEAEYFSNEETDKWVKYFMNKFGHLSDLNEEGINTMYLTNFSIIHLL